MTVEKYFMIKSPQKNDMAGSNRQPPDHQSDVHPTELPRPASSAVAILKSCSMTSANMLWMFHRSANCGPLVSCSVTAHL